MATRILSAAVAIVFAAGVLYLHDTPLFLIVLAVFSVGMLYELFNAAKLLKIRSVSVLSLVYAAVFFLQYQTGWNLYSGYFYILGMFALYLRLYNTLPFQDLFFAIAATLLIPYAMRMLLVLDGMNRHGLFLVVLTLCGAWLADTGAYFAGTFFGKHKLCPVISPKKTVEGFIGGIVTNAVLFVVISAGYNSLFADGELDFNYAGLILAGMLCAVIGVIGDLSASVIKRKCGIKDYGNIMPGHGGLLDRFDSVLFVAPFMAYMFTLGLIY
ncbi:MAG: phosphatidate cytidylyltransferase [Oscillospiraceae bacterium]